MANCKDCLHVEVCRYYTNELAKENGIPLKLEEVERLLECDDCENFKDRSRFVELPCKVGDSVFCLNPNCTFHAVRVDGANVELITSQGFILNQSLIGKTVFLTREEAEQALKEREKDE